MFHIIPALFLFLAIPILSYPSTNDPTSTGGDTTNSPNITPLSQRSAQEIIDRLNLAPNLEGGSFIETFRDPDTVSSTTNRSMSTAIYYLYDASTGASLWHRVDAAEVWHYYAGKPLTMILYHEGEEVNGKGGGHGVQRIVLGPDVFNGQQPQIVVPKTVWQRVESAGGDGDADGWTLVGTTVAPAFVEDGFELAPEGWEPYEG